MIEFNLLPDVKLEYLKSEHTKKRVFTISVIVGGISLAIIVLLFAALQLQGHQISSNKKQLKQLSDQLTGTEDINKILTIQNQLKSVIGLYNQAPEVTRLYGYLPQLVPQNVSISHLTVDFTAQTIKLSGDAPSLETINTFADTLKFATYSQTGSNVQPLPKAFTSVVLQSFTRGPNSASYSFAVAFDPILFDRAHNVKLVVPSDYISTRSFTQLPSQGLFKSSSNKSGSKP